MRNISLVLLLLAACTQVGTMELVSNDFEAGGSIPSEFTCDGEDKIPHLKWEGEPEGTKSFAITMLDPDAPAGTWTHWLVADIPVAVHEVVGGVQGTQVMNSFGKLDYGGPCPPDREHRYFFTVYALDVDKLEGLTKDNFVSTVEKHALAKAELMGRYNRR